MKPTRGGLGGLDKGVRAAGDETNELNRSCTAIFLDMVTNHDDLKTKSLSLVSVLGKKPMYLKNVKGDSLVSFVSYSLFDLSLSLVEGAL